MLVSIETMNSNVFLAYHYIKSINYSDNNEIITVTDGTNGEHQQSMTCDLIQLLNVTNHFIFNFFFEDSSVNSQRGVCLWEKYRMIKYIKRILWNFIYCTIIYLGFRSFVQLKGIFHMRKMKFHFLCQNGNLLVHVAKRVLIKSLSNKYITHQYMCKVWGFKHFTNTLTIMTKSPTENLTHP